MFAKNCCPPQLRRSIPASQPRAAQRRPPHILTLNQLQFRHSIEMLLKDFTYLRHPKKRHMYFEVSAPFAMHSRHTFNECFGFKFDIQSASSLERLLDDSFSSHSLSCASTDVNDSSTLLFESLLADSSNKALSITK